MGGNGFARGPGRRGAGDGRLWSRGAGDGVDRAGSAGVCNRAYLSGDRFLPVARRLRRRLAPTLLLALAAFVAHAQAPPPPPKIGVAVLHGKGGSPTGYVADLATYLEANGCRVANLEMPWSGRRNYDVPVAEADRELESALARLRAQGATKLFVAGHSQGGLYALYFGGKHAIDGVVAIAPGGNVASPLFREKLGESLEKARKLVAEGKGEEKTRLLDFEGSRGTYPVIAPPAAYLAWFDPEGAMNQLAAARRMNPRVPVLFVAPKGDYPGLVRVKDTMFGALPRHPLTRLYEPDADHLRAPAAARDEILRWTTEVASRSEAAAASGRQ